MQRNGRRCVPSPRCAVSRSWTSAAARLLPDASFDLAYSSLAWHYIEDVAGLLTILHRAMVPGGHLIFSTEHPIYTAPPRMGWSLDAQGRQTWPVDRCLVEGPRTTDWLAKKRPSSNIIERSGRPRCAAKRGALQRSSGMRRWARRDLRIGSRRAGAGAIRPTLTLWPQASAASRRTASRRRDSSLLEWGGCDGHGVARARFFLDGERYPKVGLASLKPDLAVCDGLRAVSETSPGLAIVYAAGEREERARRRAGGPHRDAPEHVSPEHHAGPAAA